MDSKYFRGKKAIQSLRHFTKIRLWYSVTAPWMSVLAQAQPKEYRVPLEAAGTMEFFLLRTERDENCATNSFQTRGCWWGVCLLCQQLTKEPNSWSLQRCFYRTATPDYSASTHPAAHPAASGWEFLCDRRDPDLPAGCQRHTGTPNTPCKCPISCSSSTERVLHPDKEVTAVTEPLLPRQGCTCEEAISTSLLSPKHKLWQDWTVPSTPTTIHAASAELAGSGPCPQQTAG